MNADVKIHELWSLRLNPSDLYNIERELNDNPETGGGHTYIQIPKGQVNNLLNFLHEEYPPNGVDISLNVGDRIKPEAPSEKIQFWSKSANRMRISQQNRHRHSRLTAWSPARGFPVLKPHQTTDDAKKVLNSIGGLHIYLARGTDDFVWAGFTVGTPSARESKLPFANILWGIKNPGGYWIYSEKKA
jgi:hypothetical protein